MRLIFFKCCVRGDERTAARGIALFMRVKMPNIAAAPPRAPRQRSLTSSPATVFYVVARARLLFAGTSSPSFARGFLSVWRTARRCAHLACVTSPSRNGCGAQIVQQREPHSPEAPSLRAGLWWLPGLSGAPGSVHECVLSPSLSPCLCFLTCLTRWLSPQTSDACQ